MSECAWLSKYGRPDWYVGMRIHFTWMHDLTAQHLWGSVHFCRDENITRIALSMIEYAEGSDYERVGGAVRDVFYCANMVKREAKQDDITPKHVLRWVELLAQCDPEGGCMKAYGSDLCDVALYILLQVYDAEAVDAAARMIWPHVEGVCWSNYVLGKFETDVEDAA